MEFIGTEANDTIDGTAGNDTIDGGAGDDQLTGSAGDDVIRGGLGNDSISGGGDFGLAFFASGGKDTLAGGTGDDIYAISQSAPGGTVIQDEEGNNSVFMVSENSDLTGIIAAGEGSLSEQEVIDLINNPATWGDALIELATPQSGIIGIERSDTNLVIDIDRDGIAEIKNDLTIANYFDEAENIGEGVVFVNNLSNPQEVVSFLSSEPPASGTEESGDTTAEPNPIDDENSGTTVYRFFNNNAGVHFYTANEQERDVVAGLDNFTAEGASYSAADPLIGDTVPVYRFLNQDTGVHLYTIDETERDVAASLDNFTFEGEAFSAYATEVEGSIPIYRFYNSSTGAHFYTPTATERDVVEDTQPDFQSEGIAYYALPSESEEVI